MTGLTTFPSISWRLWPETPAHFRRQVFRSRGQEAACSASKSVSVVCSWHLHRPRRTCEPTISRRRASRWWRLSAKVPGKLGKQFEQSSQLRRWAFYRTLSSHPLQAASGVSVPKFFCKLGGQFEKVRRIQLLRGWAFYRTLSSHPLMALEGGVLAICERTPLQHVLSHPNDVTDQWVKHALRPKCGNFLTRAFLCSPSRFFRNHRPKSSDPSYFGVRLLCSVCATSGAVAGKHAKADGPGPGEALASVALCC